METPQGVLAIDGNDRPKMDSCSNSVLGTVGTTHPSNVKENMENIGQLMFQRLFEIFQASSYDFRKFASPQDPLSSSFEESVDIYKMKWAIAKLLRPASILEMGVRYGYSARAFLDACPDAHYLGIDAGPPAQGSQHGAL